MDEILSTRRISEGADLSLSMSSMAESHGPELFHEPPTKRNKSDMHQTGMMHNYLYMCVLHYVYMLKGL